jgi:hypothetical protein
MIPRSAGLFIEQRRHRAEDLGRVIARARLAEDDLEILSFDDVILPHERLAA